MKLTKMVLVLGMLLVISQGAHAAVRSVKGLWVTTTDDRLYWLRLQAPAVPASEMVEELTGTIRTSSVGGSPEDATEAPVTGQYLVRTGIVVLNIGEPGTKREYAIGDTHGEGRHMKLRVFKIRPGQSIDFERELQLDPKSEPQRP
jgi:hypothetical protein